MGNKKKKKSPFAKTSAEKKEKKKDLKTECCEKYLKKGEQKRCRRCPCFDMAEARRVERFRNLEIDLNPKH